MRRATGDVNEIAERQVEIVRQRSAEFDPCLARHLRDDAILLANEEERLRHAVSTEVQLRIDTEFEHREFVIGRPLGGFLIGLESILASHASAPSMRSWRRGRSNAGSIAPHMTTYCQ